MPVAPTFPGVYIQEVPSGVHTITPVSTSIAAFLGRATLGPINRAVHIFSLADYSRSFGDPLPGSDLADSVRLFFLNGGSDCYVVRLANGALPAAVTLQSLNGANVLRAVARAEGTWGNTVRMTVDYNTTNPDESFNLHVIQESGGRVVLQEDFLNLVMDPASPRFAPDFVSASSTLVTLALHGDVGPATDPAADINDLALTFAGFSQGRRALGVAAAAPAAATAAAATLEAQIITSGRTAFMLSVNGSVPQRVDLTGMAAGLTLPNQLAFIQQRANAALAGVSPAQTVAVTSEVGTRNYLTIQATTAGAANSTVRVTRAATADLSAALLLGVDQGGVEPARRSNFRPAPTASLLRIGLTAPTSLADATERLNAIASLTQSALTQVTIDTTVVDLDVAPFNLVTTAGTALWLASAPDPAAAHGDTDGVREKLRIMVNAINAAVSATPSLRYRAELWGYHLALVSTDTTVDARPTALTTDAAAFSTGLIRNVRQDSLGNANTTGAGFFVSEQQPGDDGDAPLIADYLGNQAAQTGFYALDAVDIFNLMIIPGDVDVPQTTFNAIWGPASTYCQQRRAFLLVDPPTTWTAADRPAVVQNPTLINDLRSLVVKENAAVFYPRLRYTSGAPVRTIAPAGAIAGVMARIDSSRGIWKAPAGVEADIRGIVGLEVKLTDLENGVLNKQGANVLRVFPSGFTVWGARTLAGSDDLGSEWKYIPIRRFALFLEESLFRGTKWAVFEPNDEPLWAQVRLNLNAFMMGLFRQGAFQGSTPKDAFYVKCDAETTTQADRNLGIVNIEVGFAPLKPAEFVIIKIQQIAGEL
jgi:phage tail sheath protein FI